MRRSNPAFVEIAKAVRLVVEATAIPPDRIRDRIEALVQRDAIRLEDPAGAVMRYSDTPEYAAERYARAHRPPAARYNPHSYAARRGLMNRQPAQRSPSAPDWRDRYALNVADLEKALSRELAIDLDLGAAMAEAATPSSSSAGPITRLLEYFRANGHKPEFEKLPQDRWRLLATKAGLIVHRVGVHRGLAHSPVKTVGSRAWRVRRSASNRCCASRSRQRVKRSALNLQAFRA